MWQTPPAPANLLRLYTQGIRAAALRATNLAARAQWVEARVPHL